MNFKKEYDKLTAAAPEEIRSAEDQDTLEEIKVKYLGRKGLLSLLMRNLGSLEAEERPLWGGRLNALKKNLTEVFEERIRELSEETENSDTTDYTLPPGDISLPGRNPVLSVIEEVSEIFTQMGFGTAYGPEIETDYTNFTALNFTEDHPARDMHDTFYLRDSDALLRTHTSPVQVRIMQNYPPPYKFIAPGKCYRRDTIDASHLPVFHQVEGLMVDKHINFSHLKGILAEFAGRFFNGKVRTRFRPSFFPFTEPSAEMDIACTICEGKGCPSCGGKGWIEILGAGMVDPEVFRHCGVDSTLWQGFAFGMGAERMAMIKYGINDLRLFFQNDLRLLEQF